MKSGDAPRETPPPTETSPPPQQPAPEVDRQPERTVEEPAATADSYVVPPTSDGAGASNGDLDRVVERWDNIRMDVKALNRRTEALLQQADPVHVDGSQLTLVAAYPFHQKRLNDDDTRRTIEEVIERQVGRKLSMVCVSREEAQSLRTQGNPTQQAPQSPPANSSEHHASGREPSSERPASSPSQEDDDTDPAPEPSPPPDKAAGPALSGVQPSSAATSALERDEERIKAAINIFDAVIVDEEM